METLWEKGNGRLKKRLGGGGWRRAEEGVREGGRRKNAIKAVDGW